MPVLHLGTGIYATTAFIRHQTVNANFVAKLTMSL